MGDWGIACCPRCPGDVPLISTLHFYKAEFYCLDCGGEFGFLDPSRAANPGPELDARLEAYQAEWDEHAGRKLLDGRAWYRDCARCDDRAETHGAHATDAEVEADAIATAWLAARVKVAA